MGSAGRARRFLVEAEAYFDSLYRYALYLTREASDAEDLLQRTLLQAYQYFHRFTPGSNCRAWLVKIMKNLHLMDVRGRDVLRYPLADASGSFFSKRDTVEELYPAPLTPEELLLRKMTAEKVRAVLYALPGLFREVIMLVDLEGFTYDEAASVLGCATGTVKSRLHRARNMLKAELLRAGRSGEAIDTRSESDAL